MTDIADYYYDDYGNMHRIEYNRKKRRKLGIGKPRLVRKKK